MDFFLQLLIQGLSVGFLYALAALGFVMIFKSSSVLNFAHGELLAIGAFNHGLFRMVEITHLSLLFTDTGGDVCYGLCHRAPFSPSLDRRGAH